MYAYADNETTLFHCLYVHLILNVNMQVTSSYTRGLMRAFAPSFALASSLRTAQGRAVFPVGRDTESCWSIYCSLNQYKRASIRCYGRKSSSRALQELLDNKAEDEEDEGVVSITLKEPVAFTSPLSILKYPDPLLRAPNATIECFDDSLKSLTDEMFEIMYEDDGVGLAAPQVGVNVRLMVFNETGDREQKDAEVVLVNPRIVSTSGPKTVFEEGCLSFPALYGDVVRPRRVRVKAQDLTGKSFFMNIDKFPARIFQHEYDHLQGVLFCDRMNADVLAELRNDLVTMEEAYLQMNPDAEIQRV
jgi:peptide deformylase